MSSTHHVIIGSWWQGRGPGDPYIRMFEVECRPCRWRSRHTDQQSLARAWADQHQGTDTPPAWQRGPRRTP